MTKKCFIEINSTLQLMKNNYKDCAELVSKYNDTQLKYIIQNFNAPFTDAHYIINDDLSLTIYSVNLTVIYSNNLPPFKIKEVVRSLDYIVENIHDLSEINFNIIPETIGNVLKISFNDVKNSTIDFESLEHKNIDTVHIFINRKNDCTVNGFDTNKLINIKNGLSKITNFEIFNTSVHNDNCFELIRNLSCLFSYNIFITFEKQAYIGKIKKFFEDMFKLFPPTISINGGFNITINSSLDIEKFNVIPEFLKIINILELNINTFRTRELYKLLNILKVLFVNPSFNDVETAFNIFDIKTIKILKQIKVLNDKHLYPFRSKFLLHEFNL